MPKSLQRMKEIAVNPEAVVVKYRLMKNNL
jgi:hypothetical protein